jgi:phage terminase large subunit-like protein
MGILMVPRSDEKPWPTLGEQLCSFLEDRCVHGPGDLKGKPYRLDDDKRALLYRMYEVYPREHPRAGKRRFKRCAVSLRKGTAKTELAAAVAFGELHPEGPVRTTGWRRRGRLWEPVGGPVTDPYIPMVAYTEEQTEDLAYAALLVMVTEGEDADLFDAGLDRILRLDDRGRADGKAVALASAPDSRDGARTTFQHFDETHRFTLPRLVEAHETMLQNIPKRMLADPWSLETTTTYTPGTGSVAEAAHEVADEIAAGRVTDSTYFFFHRDATPVEGENLDDPKQLRAAIREASGPAIATWDDFEGQVESIATLYSQAKQRGNQWYFERVWLNRRRQSGRQAFDATLWAGLVANDGFVIPDKDPVVVGFDGSRWRDSTALVLTTVEGFQQAFRIWEHDGTEGWEVPEGEVDAAVEEIARRWKLIRLYGDPAQGWDVALARWAGKYGQRKVFMFYTDSRNQRRTGTAFRAYHSAIRGGDISHDGDATMARHIGNACKRVLPTVDEDGQPLWTIEKERRDSLKKIDYAMAGCLSWQARIDAIAAKELRRIKRTLVVQ